MVSAIGSLLNTFLSAPKELRKDITELSTLPHVLGGCMPECKEVISGDLCEEGLLLALMCPRAEIIRMQLSNLLASIGKGSCVGLATLQVPTALVPLHAMLIHILNSHLIGLVFDIFCGCARAVRIFQPGERRVEPAPFARLVAETPHSNVDPKEAKQFNDPFESRMGLHHAALRLFNKEGNPRVLIEMLQWASTPVARGWQETGMGFKVCVWGGDVARQKQW